MQVNTDMEEWDKRVDTIQCAVQEVVGMKLWGAVVYVDDVPAVLDFYYRAFGCEARFFDPVYQFAELDTGAATLAFASHQLGELLMAGAYVPPGHSQPCGVEIAFMTPDVAGAFAKAIDAGAVVVAEPKVMPWGATVAYVRSIEGTLIGFSTPPASI